jgi:glycosyltransferase involved in cell wall biosynthesis
MLHSETLIGEVKTLGKEPAVSVVMPAYNVAPYIRETLDSVFAQTFTDFEVVIVNDGSPDTIELERALEPYMNRIRYIKQENRGAGAARNEAVRAARGEFVAFLDADDLWLPGYLEEQLAFLRERQCDLVCADALHFGDSPLAGRTYMEAFMEKAPPTGEVTFLGLVSAEQSLITSGVLARREPILQVGLFDETLRNSQDFDLWLRLLRHGARLAYQRRLLVHYRFHENSLSGDEINRNTRQLRVYDKIENSFDLAPDERTEVARALRGRRAILEFELGKLYLEQGDVERAREAFTKANNLQPSWKTRLAVLLARRAPRLLKRLQLRRTRKAFEKQSDRKLNAHG